MLELYTAGEPPITGADSRSLCRAIRMRGQVDPIFIENREEIGDLLKGVLHDKDIVLVLGAGDVAAVATSVWQQYGDQDVRH
jgi:UDP-N-acetylmuramate--alanine ligase